MNKYSIPRKSLYTDTVKTLMEKYPEFQYKVLDNSMTIMIDKCKYIHLWKNYVSISVAIEESSIVVTHHTFDDNSPNNEISYILSLNLNEISKHLDELIYAWNIAKNNFTVNLQLDSI